MTTYFQKEKPISGKALLSEILNGSYCLMILLISEVIHIYNFEF